MTKIETKTEDEIKTEAADKLLATQLEKLGVSMGGPKLEKIDESYYFKRFGEAKKEAGDLQGSISDETEQKTPSRETAAQVILGQTKWSNIDWCHHFTTDKPLFVIPKATLGGFRAMASGVLTGSPAYVTGSNVSLAAEDGLDCNWTRAYLEDADYAVMSEQNELAGKALAIWKTQRALDKLTGSLTWAGAGAKPTLAGAQWITSGSTGITISDFRKLLADVDVRGYGPPTHFICSPAIFWQLLDEEEFTSALYAGNDEVMRSGILKTTFGVDIVRVDTMKITSGSVNVNMCAAINKDKAVGFVTRRDALIEPYERPETNTYGFTISTRFACADIWTGAAVFGLQLD